MYAPGNRARKVTTTMDHNNDDDELTGDTHLLARFCPDWGNSSEEWDDGQIHLEGELDFPADQPGHEVGAALQERAEAIGALVSHDESAGLIEAYPWNGPGHFVLSYDADEEDACISEIAVFDGNGNKAQHDTMEQLKADGRKAKKIADNLVPADESEDMETAGPFRITTDGLVPVDEDDVDL